MATHSGNFFADIIVPLALPQTYTFSVPEPLVTQVVPGLRVEVQFARNKHYTGVVHKVHTQPPEHRTKPIISLIDTLPIITEKQLQLWVWLAEYYACALGEVMNAGLPSHLKLANETTVTLGPFFNDAAEELDDEEYMVVEALTLQSSLSLKDIRDILQKKTIYPVIRRLLDRRIIALLEGLQDRYKPKVVRYLRFGPDFQTEAARAGAFDLVARSAKQTAVLMEFLTLQGQGTSIRPNDLTRRTEATTAVVSALVKKGIFEYYEQQTSRIGGQNATEVANQMSAQQERARTQVQGFHAASQPVLLHGVTGSGKTRVYLDLMQRRIAAGEQVLYLLPEIALTDQIIRRLQRVLGDKILVYHSKLSDMERVEIWQAVHAGTASIAGPRSALFLPFTRLGLIIVDEEHDPSYKQHDPSPRYNGRDVAVFLAHLHDARIVLGSATPSLESWENVRRGKYGLVTMSERFGGLALPDILIADAREEDARGNRHPFFTPTLLAAIKTTLAAREQVILFQNRRGFAPVYFCPACEYTMECVSCDISLTYHKFQHRLRCHCCGYSSSPPEACPACGSMPMQLSGAGTQKIEDELKIFLPEARIARMDADTTRGKNALAKIIHRFEAGDLDILVGTQMVTKGLDFERVGLVGIISADQLLRFPDFRADERAFQLMTQVAGRAGRKHRQGKVIIQAADLHHPVLQQVHQGDWDGFINREQHNRASHHFPPYTRMIYLQLRHPRSHVVEEAAKLMYNWLVQVLRDQITPPFTPSVARIRNFYLQDMVIRLPNHTPELRRIKAFLLRATQKLSATKGLTSVRVVINVDPY